MTTVQEREMLALGQAEVVTKQELTRLREIEAREVAVTNFFAAIVMFGERKISEEKFITIVQSHETVLASAVESLARRDSIRRLEGAVDALQLVLLQGHLRKTLQYYQNQLAEARAK